MTDERQATMRASVSVGTLSPSALDDPAAAYGRKVWFLGRVSLLRGAPQDAIAHLAAALTAKPVAAGDVVFRRGDPGADLYLVESGTFDVTADGVPEVRELAVLGPGDFFGEMALLGQGRRSATVRARTDGNLWALSATDFDQLLARHPELAAAVRRTAATRRAAGGSGAFDVLEHDVGTAVANRGALRLGRDESNDVVFASPLVSRLHAVIEPTAGGFRVRDLDSANGTYVNGVRVRAAELHDGDELWVADERFVFEQQSLFRTLEPEGIRVDLVGVGKRVGEKQLLADVDLSILAGEFVAIVGGSGAGKSTLMDAMSGVRPATSGSVLYNGRDYYSSLSLFRNVLGYVPQDDIIHLNLPLELTLRHAAKLRLPPDTTPEQLDAAIDGTLAELELTAQRGIKVEKLSGGQRKRASIGVELLTQPRIFFLDEPTSGLDPLSDAQMMKLLRRLADSGSTVVLTTHATKNVMLCDKVVFVHRGRLAFAGTPQRALEYFEADAFDRIYERLATESTPEEWGERFRASTDHERALGNGSDGAGPDGSASARASLAETRSGGLSQQFRQLRVLSGRTFDLIRHNPSVLPSLAAPPILFAVLALALFHRGTFEKTANSAASLQVCFLLAFSAFIFGLLFGVQEIVREFAIFRRERMVGVGIAPYILSKTVFLAPLLSVLLLVMVLILRVTGRLPAAGFGLYWQLMVTLILTGFAGLAISLFTSSFVATSQQATDLLSVWIMPQVLFGGALLAVPAMTAIGRAIAAIAPVRWSFEGIGHITDLSTQFRTDTSQVGPGLAIQYGTSFDHALTLNWILLGVFTVVPLCLTYLVLRQRTRAK